MVGIGIGVGMEFLRPRGGGVVSGAAAMLAAEAQGLAIDFTDMSMVIKDTGTPANNFSGDPNAKLTYAAPSTKWVLGANGLYSSGTTLRTSYDGSGNKLGLLIEEARTNSLAYSSDLTNAAWALINGTVTANAAVSPNGTSDAAKLIANTSSGTHATNPTFTPTTATTYTKSVFAKKGEYDYVVLQMNFGGLNGYSIFNLNTGAMGATTAGLTSRSITPVGNGWYLCTITATTSSAVAGPTRIWVQTTDSIGAFSGDNASGVYLWNPKLEAGGLATSPIVTAGSTVTRAVDNISLAEALFPNSTSTMLLMASFNALALGTSRYALVYGNATGTEYMALRQDTSNFMRATTFTAGVAQSTQTDSIAELSGVHSIAVSVATNNVLSAKNGALLAAADTSATVPNPDTLYLGQFTPGGNTMNAYLRKILVLPRAAVNQAEINGIAA